LLKNGDSFLGESKTNWRIVEDLNLCAPYGALAFQASPFSLSGNDPKSKTQNKKPGTESGLLEVVY
jgi:hypothetical protein